MYNPLTVKICESIDNLSQIVQSNLFFPLNKFHIFIDPLEQPKEISEPTILEYLTNILFSLQSLVILDNTRMIHSTKYKAFYDSFMNFTLLHHSLLADSL